MAPSWSQVGSCDLGSSTELPRSQLPVPRPAAAITKRKLRPIPSDIQEVRVIIARSAVTGAVVATLETDPDGSRYCVAFTDLEEILLVDLFAYGTQRTIRTHEYHVYGWD